MRLLYHESAQPRGSTPEFFALSSESKSDGLTEYLDKRLAGSSLRIVPKSDHELEVQAFDDIVLRVITDSKKKSLRFSLFSPKLNRDVTFENIGDSTFLDVRLGDELKGENHEAEEADITLAINLLERWAKENDHTLSHGA